MDNKTIEDKFRELCKDAKTDPSQYCYLRSYELANTIIKEVGEDKIVEQWKIVPKEKQYLEPKDLTGILWQCHYTIMYDGEIWDSAFGKRFPIDVYLSNAFPGQNVEIEQKDQVKIPYY